MYVMIANTTFSYYFKNIFRKHVPTSPSQELTCNGVMDVKAFWEL